MGDQQLAVITNEGQDIVPAPAPETEENRLLTQSLSAVQRDFLLQRTPKHEIKYRQGKGGMQFAYVEHGYVTERLNMIFGFNWDFEVVDKQILEDEVIVEAKLTVRTPAGQTIVKTQFGGADIKRNSSGAKSGKPLSIADDYKAAASDALKKCASLLGIGLDLYGRDRPVDSTGLEEDNQPVRSRQNGAQSRKSVPDAPPPPRLCEPAQIEEIRTLIAKVGMPEHELCESLQVEGLQALQYNRANRVITRLHEVAIAEAQAEAEADQDSGLPADATEQEVVFQEQLEQTPEQKLKSELTQKIVSHINAIPGMTPTMRDDLLRTYMQGRRDTNPPIDALQIILEKLQPVKTMKQVQDRIADFRTASEMLDQSKLPITIQGAQPKDADWDRMKDPVQTRAEQQRPLLKQDGNPLTPAQLRAIYAAGKGIKRLSEQQVEDRCIEIYGLRPSELTKSEASSFIDMLKGEAA